MESPHPIESISCPAAAYEGLCAWIGGQVNDQINTWWIQNTSMEVVAVARVNYSVDSSPSMAIDWMETRQEIKRPLSPHRVNEITCPPFYSSWTRVPSTPWVFANKSNLHRSWIIQLYSMARGDWHTLLSLPVSHPVCCTTSHSCVLV